MTSFFDRLFRTYPVKTRRFLELAIGTITWLVILAPLWGSFFVPLYMAYFVVFFDVYWLYKSFQLVRTSYIATKKIRQAENTDWLEKARNHEHFQKVNHVLIIPNYKERVEKLSITLDNLLKQTMPLKRLHVVLAMEEREKEAEDKAETLIKMYRGKFGSIFATYHPDIEGEVKGKSSNEAYAGRVAYDRLFVHGDLDLDYATVSSVDADALFDPQYFSCLSYKFLIDTKRYNRFWQSAVVFYNNIWQVPSPTRVISFFGSLWRTALLVQGGDRLITQSTYSLSYKMLVAIDFWDTDVIPEDFRIFFKAFYRLKGQAWVAPIFLKTSMDAAYSGTYLKSLKNRYQQERRWSWGVSDDPLFIQWWLTVPGIPFARKTIMLYHVLLDHILWPTNWFIITIAANIMPLINPVFSRTTLGHSLPGLAGFVLTICLFAVVALIYIDFKNRPENSKLPVYRKFLFPLEFLLMPVIGFFFSALPALVSHTAMMLGKRLEYKVTEKA